jgi:hypothetical protein
VIQSSSCTEHLIWADGGSPRDRSWIYFRYLLSRLVSPVRRNLHFHRREHSAFAAEEPNLKFASGARRFRQASTMWVGSAPKTSCRCSTLLPQRHTPVEGCHKLPGFRKSMMTRQVIHRPVNPRRHKTMRTCFHKQGAPATVPPAGTMFTAPLQIANVAPPDYVPQITDLLRPGAVRSRRNSARCHHGRQQCAQAGLEHRLATPETLGNHGTHSGRREAARSLHRLVPLWSRDATRAKLPVLRKFLGCFSHFSAKSRIVRVEGSAPGRATQIITPSARRNSFNLLTHKP